MTRTIHDGSRGADAPAATAPQADAPAATAPQADAPAATTRAADVPDNDRAELLRRITDGVTALTSRHRCTVAQRVHHSGISLTHLQILWILQEHGPLPVSRLAAWLGIGVPNATGLLDRMEQRGLVERVRDADDRRVVLARRTDLGRATIEEIDGWRAGLIESVLAPVPTRHLAAVLEAIHEATAAVPTHPVERPTAPPPGAPRP